jgi:hypothetical protein
MNTSPLLERHFDIGNATRELATHLFNQNEEYWNVLQRCVMIQTRSMQKIRMTGQEEESTVLVE